MSGFILDSAAEPVIEGEAAGGQRGEGVAEGVKPVHPPDDAQEQDLDERQDDVEAEED